MSCGVPWGAVGVDQLLAPFLLSVFLILCFALSFYSPPASLLSRPVCTRCGYILDVACDWGL